MFSNCRFVYSSITNVVTCEYDILETNEPIDANYHNRPRSKSTKWSTLGVRRSNQGHMKLTTEIQFPDTKNGPNCEKNGYLCHQQAGYGFVDSAFFLPPPLPFFFALLHRESGTPCHSISVLLPSAENSSGLGSKPTSLSAPTHDSPPRTIEECNYLHVLTYLL